MYTILQNNDHTQALLNINFSGKYSTFKVCPFICACDDLCQKQLHDSVKGIK